MDLKFKELFYRIQLLIDAKEVADFAAPIAEVAGRVGAALAVGAGGPIDAATRMFLGERRFKDRVEALERFVEQT
jgi:predicted RNA methylase